MPGAMLAVLVAARFVYGWFVPVAGTWWTAAIDAGLVACIFLLVYYYVRVINSRIEAAETVAERVGHLELVTRELVDHEAMMREELVRGHRELNERIVRLSGLLDAGRELVGARDLEDALQHVADMARSVMGADLATIRTSIGNENLSVVSSDTDDEDELLFRFSSQIAARGAGVGELSVEFANIDPGNVDAGNLLAIISAFAGAAIENAVLYRNLTDANEKLQVSRRYAERLVEEVPVGMVVIDDEFDVITWNRALAESIGVPSHVAEGMSLSDIFTGTDMEQFLDMIEETASGTDSTVIETLTLRIKSGEDYVFRVIVSPVERLFGESQGFIIMAEDVTDKARLGEQMKQAERLKVLGEFAAGMAHEINNPMGIISACAEVMAKKLSRRGPELEECVKTARIIQDEAIRCSSIVKNLLGFARQSEMNPEEVDIKGLLNQTVEFISGRAAAANVELVLDVDDDFPLMVGDAHQLEQVFLNLSINAIEAMPDGGRLEISARCDGDEARVFFSDTGPGIRDAAAHKLFNPFFTTKAGGTGLGLAVSLGIAERHGGRIDIGASEAGGACFTVILPLTAGAWERHLSFDIEKHLHAGEQNLPTDKNK
jgi:PAS domain S-box-containing protein